MTKVMICLPMQGKTTDVIKAEIRAMKTRIRALFKECEFIDSYFTNAHLFTPLENLGSSIKLMADADVVAFPPKWWKARGCVVEHIAATNYDKEIVYL